MEEESSPLCRQHRVCQLLFSELVEQGNVAHQKNFYQNSHRLLTFHLWKIIATWKPIHQLEFPVNRLYHFEADKRRLGKKPVQLWQQYTFFLLSGFCKDIARHVCSGNFWRAIKCRTFFQYLTDGVYKSYNEFGSLQTFKACRSFKAAGTHRDLCEYWPSSVVILSYQRYF